MADLEQTFNFKNVKVRYKTRESKKDRRHLVVMFSGIRPKRDYELDGSAMSSSQASWLWIRDDFDGEHAYYMCKGMDFSIESAVIALIEKRLMELNLSEKECTLIGFSKGASAALYFGLKYEFRNIIATVPQISIGSYIRDTRPRILAHMTRGGDVEDVSKLDALIPDIASNDTNLDRNIYIWSSPGDEEFSTQVEPFIKSFEKYDNFNVILTKSKLVDAHVEVTRYNLPTILAVLAFVVDGIAPSFGQVVNGGEEMLVHSGVGPELQEERIGLDVVELHQSSISKDRWFPRGVAFRKGAQASSHRDLRRSILLKSTSRSEIFAIGSTKNRWNSSAYYDSTYRDYSHASFATMQHSGIPLLQLDDGAYDVSMLIDTQGVESISPVTAPGGISSVAACGSKLIFVIGNGSGTVLEKRSIVGRSALSVDFTTYGYWVREDRFHIEGRFAVEGLEADHWSKVRYFLVLSDGDIQMSFDLGSGKRPDQIGLFGCSLADYSAAYYATPSYEGVSMSELPNGTYQVVVTMVHGIFTYSETSNICVNIVDGKPHLDSSE